MIKFLFQSTNSSILELFNQSINLETNWVSYYSTKVLINHYYQSTNQNNKLMSQSFNDKAKLIDK